MPNIVHSMNSIGVMEFLAVVSTRNTKSGMTVDISTTALNAGLSGSNELTMF